MCVCSGVRVGVRVGGWGGGGVLIHSESMCHGVLVKGNWYYHFVVHLCPQEGKPKLSIRLYCTIPEHIELCIVRQLQ